MAKKGHFLLGFVFGAAMRSRRAVTMLTGHKPWLIMMLQPNNYAIS